MGSGWGSVSAHKWNQESNSGFSSSSIKISFSSSSWLVSGYS
jgi:hypothetical protein